MANKIKGQRSIEINGERYTVHYDFNALAELEEATGKDTSDIMQELAKMQEEQRLSITFLRTLAWAGFLRHHGLTLNEVGELMSQSELPQLFSAVGEAFATSLMSEEDWESAQKKGTAQKKRGTGKKS
ncbi:hypothetical protein [Laceyella putida]|uniref:Uncharacterized protein n=1 Tax=Laceyella putida TaxID=110101 RepID=A0ABW2RQW0_9BACL